MRTSPVSTCCRQNAFVSERSLPWPLDLPRILAAPHLSNNSHQASHIPLEAAQKIADPWQLSFSLDLNLQAAAIKA